MSRSRLKSGSPLTLQSVERLHREASDHPGASFLLGMSGNQKRDRNIAGRSRGGNRLFLDDAETKASLRWSIFFLTLPDSASSASRNSQAFGRLIQNSVVALRTLQDALELNESSHFLTADSEMWHLGKGEDLSLA